MSTTGLVVSFALLWWLILFLLLPMGVQIPHEAEEGHAPSAPDDPRLGAKIVITTLLAVLATGGMHYCFSNGIFVWPSHG